MTESPELTRSDVAPADGHESRIWPGRVLKSLLWVELLNLFSIVTTEGAVQLLPFSDDRFVSFVGHATLLWSLFVATQWVEFRRDGVRSGRIRIACSLVLAGSIIGCYLYFAYGLRLSADGPHYFVIARSLLFDGDLDFSNDYLLVRAPLPIAERYPLGTPLLSLPFLLAAHGLLVIASWLGRGLEPSGFGNAYETAFGLAGYFFASWALVRGLRTLSRYFPVSTSFIALCSVWSASFLVWYMVVEPSMPHAMSFAFSSFFLCYWLDNRPLEGPRQWLWLGLLAGLASLVRWQNGVLLALPLLDRLLDAPRPWRNMFLSVLGFALAFMPQLIFWRRTAADALALPLEGHGVAFDQLSLLEVLYSTNRGLFPWNPVLYLSVMGLLAWVGVARRLALLGLLGFGIQAFVNGSVAIWWAGWSFGGRRFDSCLPLFMLGAAALVELLRRRPLVLVVALFAGLTLWNYGLMEQTRSGAIPPDRLVSFRGVWTRTLQRGYDAFGLPPAWPMNWWFSWRHRITPERFDQLYGHQGFGNFRFAFDSGIEPYLGRGWSAQETNATGEPFRWTVGSTSTILVPLKVARDYNLTLELDPYGPTSPNHVMLAVNGHALPLQLASKRSQMSWRIPARVWSRGVNQLQFSMEKALRPSELSSSPDSRPLGAAFFRIDLVVVPFGDSP
ncbi:MAG TPA: hypothetical protein VLK65_16030 [Vicinamibacteria bacterium]|nr:hypothetical protein [Vicinamibacteria bacterium]